MIAKISSTENLGGALGYNFKKVEKGEASILLAQGLYQNKEGTYTMAEVFTDMQAVIPEKCRTKKMVFHCSLNPHPDEKLSNETLTQIAREYMETLGYGKQPYIVFKHNDIAREHIHIVSLRVDSEGKKINDKFEKRRSKQITDTLERKYNLIPSSKVSNKEEVETPKVEEFRGKKYDGLVYVPTDDKGGKVSTPIHASDIGRGVGYTAVQNRMQKSKQAIKPLVPTIRGKVLQAMRTSPQTEKELRSRLEEQSLRVAIRKNESGRIYGITFIDDKVGVALNGSRLGKGYAANVFNTYFSNPTNNPFLDETLYGNPSVRLEQSATVQPLQSNAEEGDNLIDELIENIVGDTFGTTGNDDWKEAVWQRKLRKQSKVKLRRRKH